MLLTFKQLPALGSISSIVVICSRNEVSRKPGLTSGSKRAVGLSTNNIFRFIANAAMSIGKVLNGFQFVWNPTTWPCLQMGPAHLAAPVKATGHTPTVCMSRIWCRGRKNIVSTRCSNGCGSTALESFWLQKTSLNYCLPVFPDFTEQMESMLVTRASNFTSK